MCQNSFITIFKARISRIYTDKFIIFPCNPRNPCLNCVYCKQDFLFDTPSLFLFKQTVPRDVRNRQPRCRLTLIFSSAGYWRWSFR